MKRLIPEEYRKISRAAMAVIAFTMVLVAVLVYLDRLTAFFSFILSTLTPFFVGGALAFVQMPIDRKISSALRKTLFRKKPGAKALRVISALSSLLLLVLLITLFLYILLPQLYTSINTLVRQVTRFVSEHEKDINDMLKKVGLVKEDVETLDSAWQDLLSYASNYIGLVPGVLMSSYNLVYRVIFNFSLGLIVSFYMLLDRERLARQGRKLCYAVLRKDICGQFLYWMRQANRTFAGFTTGKLIDSLVVGIICYLFMLIAGLEYSVLISVLIGVTNILPFFGPIIGAVPSVLILLIVNPTSALTFTIFILILQQVDGNIIGPKILGDYTGISPLLSMFAILLGSALFGFVGLLVSVPVCAVLYAVFKTAMNHRLQLRGLPTDTACYEEIAPREEPAPEQSAKG